MTYVTGDTHVPRHIANVKNGTDEISRFKWLFGEDYIRFRRENNYGSAYRIGILYELNQTQSGWDIKYRNDSVNHE